MNNPIGVAKNIRIEKGVLKVDIELSDDFKKFLEELEAPKLRKALRTELNEVTEIGEDGETMAVACKTELGAFRMFKAWVRKHVGEGEASELERQNVGIGWLRLMKPGEYNPYDSDWCVSYVEKSDFPVWVYQY